MANKFGDDVTDSPSASVNKFGDAPVENDAFSVAARRTRQAVKPEGGRKESHITGQDLGAFAAHAIHGVSLGTADEMAGLLAEQGLGDAGAIGAPPLVAHPESIRSQVQKNVRDYLTRSKAESPVASGLGEFGGGLGTALAIPARAIGPGASTLARVGSGLYQGTKVGAITGGIQGAGEAEGGLGDRITEGAKGFALGAAGGLAGSAIGQAVTGVAKTAASAIARPLETFFAPRRTAAKMLASEGGADIAAGHGGLTEREFNTMNAEGQPVITADLFGERARSLTRWAGTISPEARQNMSMFADERFRGKRELSGGIAGQASRGAATAENLTGGRVTHDVEEAAQKAYDADRTVAYNNAHAAGDRPIDSPELQRLTSSEDVVAALKKATQTASSREVAEGGGAFNNKVEITPDGRIMFRNKGGLSPYPNLRMWDYAKQELDAAIAKAKRDGDNGRVGYLSRTVSDLTKELDRMVPEYKTARGVAANYFGTNDLLEAGAAASAMKDSAVPGLQKMMTKATPAEASLIRIGHATALAGKLRDAGDSTEATNQVFQNITARKVMQAIHGPLGVDQLEMWIRRENIMRKFDEGTGSKNSWTARNIMDAMALGLVGSSAGFYLRGWEGAGEGGTLGAGFRLGGTMLANKLGLQRQLANHIAELALSKDPAAVKKFVDLASGNPRIGRFVRIMDNIMHDTPARVGGYSGQEAVRNAPALME